MRTTLISLMNGASSLAGCNGVLTVGDEQFQMRAEECDYFAMLIRQHQRVLVHLGG